jgi:hypothetical protein
MVDTKYPHSDQAFRLCRLLGEPLADALPVRLWCWGIETDREDGRFSADAKQLAQIVRFEGNSDELLRAFLDCDVIAPTENKDEYRIRGWKLNAKFFKERRRLKQYSKDKKPREKNADSTRGKRVAHGDPYPFPSSSSLGGDPPNPPTTIGEAKRLLVAAPEARELYEHWRQEQIRIHSRARPMIAPALALEGSRAVLVSSPMDEAKRVVTAFVESKHKFWADNEHALSLLTNPRDLERAQNAASGKPKASSMADKVAEEKRRFAERQRAEEEAAV